MSAAMAAAMESAAAATTVGFTTAEALSATESAVMPSGVAAVMTFTGVAVSVCVSLAAIPSSAPVSVIMVPATTITPTAIPEPRRMAPVVPRAHPDERSIHEIIRGIVAVGRTSIGIIVVVPVDTSRRSGHVTRTDSDSHSNPNLRLGIR